MVRVALVSGIQHGDTVFFRFFSTAEASRPAPALPSGLRLERVGLACRRPGVGSSSWEDPLEKGRATPVFLPGEFHEQQRSAGCSPWGRTESDTTEWLTLSLFHHRFLQDTACSSLCCAIGPCCLFCINYCVYVNPKLRFIPLFPSSLVTINLFSVSVTLFLFHKYLYCSSYCLL